MSDVRWMVVFSAILVAACDGGTSGVDAAEDTAVDEAGGAGAGGDDGGAGDAGDAPTYADVAPILTQNCVVCHSDPPSGGAPFSLDGYAAASAKATRIVARAVDGDPRPMPPGGLALSDAEAETLVAWLDAGAPE